MRHLLNLAIIVGIGVGATGVAHASYSTGTPAYAYSYAPTQLAAVSTCDDCAAVVNLPWAFPYWGRSFTQVSVSSNGTVTFGSNTAAPFSNGALGPNGGALPGPSIAVLWDDWNPSAGGSIYTGVSGSAFVIEWYGVYHYGQTSGAGASFELKLFADGHFETHYGNMATGYASNMGLSATIGLQEDVDTVAQQVSYNATVASSSARSFYRPGASAIYVNAKDGFYSPARVRQHIKYGQSVYCASSGAWSWVEVTTGAGDWSWGVNNCAGASLYGAASFMGDTQGYDVASIPLSSITDVTHGTYHFIRRADLTPAPAVATRFTPYYGVGTSKLDYWSASGAVADTTLLVTGFDPLNESSTAEYMVLLGDLARQLLAEGRTIAIGKFGDGNQRLPSFNDEVGRWVNDAYGRQGNRRLQLAGVSMGGVVVRSTIANNNWSVQSKLTAWYSVDSPQTGANLGRGDRGIQNLVLCNKDASDPQYKQLFSNPAADMMTLWVSSCDRSWEPENSSCSVTTAYHDGYYNSVGWPTVLPRYAVAFGDANASGGYAKQGSGKLFDFEYTGLFCSEDRDWNGGQRDCNAGSRYMVAADVNTDEDASLCGTFKLRLKYSPSFINTDSALGVATGLSSNAEDGSRSSNYPTLAPTYWNGWASNDYNELHTVLSSSLKNTFVTWIHANTPAGS